MLFNRFPPILTIHYKRLIKVITSALSYYPYRNREDTFEATFNSTFPELMYYYQELKHYFNLYLQSLSQDERLNKKLEIGNCSDENFIKLMQLSLELDGFKDLPNLCNERTAKDLAVLLRLLASMYRTKVAPTLTSTYFKEKPMVAYDNVWILFKPGTTVYVKQLAF